MSKIIIIGTGSMGAAFSIPCVDNNHDTTIVGTHLEDLFIDQIKKANNKHPALKVQIPSQVNLVKFKQFNEILNSKVDIIVIAVSSKGIDWVTDQLVSFYKDKSLPEILVLTKGLSVENNKYETIPDKIKKKLTKNKIKIKSISAIGGPCLAVGLSNKAHTSVILANEDIRIAKQISNILKNNYYHISYTDDLFGVEICVAIKNIFSMSVGTAFGKCLEGAKNELKEKTYLNTASSLITQSIFEMELFVKSLKGKKETVYGAAGFGDLYVSSTGGRNSKMGLHIGNGLTFDEAKNTFMKNITVEGADLAFEIGHKVKKDFTIKQLPLMISMINSITENKEFKLNWDDFN